MACPLFGSSARRFAVVTAWLAAAFVPWVHAASDLLAARLTAADAKRGKTLFLQCAACHVARPGATATLGPNLWSVVGRGVAKQAGYTYSESLLEVDGRWDYMLLDRYLRDPKAVAPGGRMAFPGIKADSDRADLIAYLRTLSDDPVALPQATAAGPTSIEPATIAQDERFKGLPAGAGREEVVYLCSSCHSLMIVKQQDLSRDRWDQALEWMVEEQGMQPIQDAAVRARVLDYLSTHFGAN